MAKKIALPRAGAYRRTLAVVLLVLSLAHGAAPRAQQVNEPALKAAFVLNFAKFVEWPEGHPARSGAAVICSADPAVAAELQAAVAAIPGDKHRIEIRGIAPPAGVTGCSVAYLNKLDDRQLSELMPVLHAASVLSVSDMPDFARRGGMIHLYFKSGRMRFALNLRPFTLARLKPDVRLMTLAESILN